jgi:hypothetical protein
MKRILSILLLLSFFSGHLLAGEHPKGAIKMIMISGKVLDPKSNELLAGVKIECEACQKVVYSDLDGRFFIYLQVETSQQVAIEFSQVGYAARTLNLQEIGANAANLEISLVAE